MKLNLLAILFTSWISVILGNGIPVFKINGEQCLDQPVEYQCTVNGSGINILIWRVYTDNGTQITGSPHTYTSITIGASVSIGGVFTVEQLSQSPLISNISFTVQSSINGYTIICEDGITLNNENLTIDISGIIEPPNNISFTSSESSVIIAWTQPMSSCVSSYSITSNATNSIITTTDTSVDIPLAGLSPGVYCVSVATVDTANRTGNYSNEECVTLQAPPLPEYSYELSAAESLNNAIATVSLIFNLSSTVPIVTAGYIVVDSQESKGELTTYNKNQISFKFSITLERGVNHSIMCFGENVLGNGSIVTFNIYVDLSDVLPTPSVPNYDMSSTSTAMIVVTSSIRSSFTSVTVSPSTSSSQSPTPLKSGNLLTVVVLIVVIVVIIILILVITFSVLICCWIIFKRRSKVKNHQTKVNVDLVQVTENTSESSTPDDDCNEVQESELHELPLKNSVADEDYTSYITGHHPSIEKSWSSHGHQPSQQLINISSSPPATISQYSYAFHVDTQIEDAPQTRPMPSSVYNYVSLDHF